MKKTPDHRFMHRSRLQSCCRPLAFGAAAILSSVIFLAACTTYRPLDQGAHVPWAKALAATKGGPIDGNRYRVGEGDALSRIAAQYDIRMSTLAAANNIQAPYVLYPGEVLRIPADAPMPTKRPEIVQAALPPISSTTTQPPAWTRQAEPARDVGGKRYVVEPGESLALIAHRNGLTLGEMVAVNGIEPPYRIAPGQVLVIPSKEGVSFGHDKQAKRQEGRETASSMAPPPPLSEEGFLWPADGELIGSFKENSDNGRSGGVTIAARRGAPVLAADNGIVAYAGEALSGYGRMIMLRHAEGYVTLYAHNDAILVREGDVVGRGQMIAEAGSSGDVTDSQLHFELRKGTVPIDPTRVLAGLPGRQIGKL